MFSPPGYVAIADLWKEFFVKYRLRLTGIALSRYGDDFSNLNKLGSPDDFCEEIFLSTLNGRGIFAATTDGQVMKLTSGLIEEPSQLFLRMDTIDSQTAASEVREAGTSDNGQRKIGSSAFAPLKLKIDLITKWKEIYAPVELQELPAPVYHTLPRVFERGGTVRGT